jgi:hypothetical protein
MTASAAGPTRFVLPPDAPLLANLSALWWSDGKLARELEALGDEPGYPVELARNGQATLSLATPTGKRMLLHSRFEPAIEAAKFVEKVLVEEKSLFYVLGLGLGYSLQSLFERAGEEAIFCIFEPDLRLIWTALQYNDISKLIRSRRVLFFTKLDKSDMFTRLNGHSALISVGSHEVPDPVSLALQPDFFAQIRVWIGELASFVRTGMNTLVLNSGKTAENIAANIGWYAATPSAQRLHDRFKGKPAVIVSAGPSLRKNKHLLNDLQDKAVVIAVQTTLQPLVEMGVRPRFVTSLDYHEICSRFFEKLPADLKTELVAEPKATEAIYKLFPGPVTVLGNEFAEALVREVKLEKTALPAGATVAHLAYYLAEHLGCDPIIFVGQDLAFSDGLCYTPGTSYEDVWRPELSRHCTVEMKQWEQIVRERYILRRVPDAQGNALYTEERLFMYLQQFERDFGTSHATIIDATEGGALKRGATPMPLAEAMEKYCNEPLEKQADDYPGVNWDLLEQCIVSLRKRREEAEEIGRISQETLPLLEEIRDYVGDHARVNRLIAHVDQLRVKMSDLGRTYDQVTQLTQQTEMDRFKRDRKVSASKATGAKRQRLQVERDIENVKAIVGAAAAFVDLMDQTILQLEERIAAQACVKAQSCVAAA